MEKRYKLIALRGKRTKAEVSKHMGITPQMLGRIERGERNPSIVVAGRIATYYDVTIDELFK